MGSNSKISKTVSALTITGSLFLSGCFAEQSNQFFGLDTPGVASIAPSTTLLLASPTPTLNSDLCVSNPSAAACQSTPVVTTPGVVTVLFTMSEIPQGAGTLIVGNAIKYASPVTNPKILFLKDSATHGEDEGDPDYIKNTLLASYSVTYAVIPVGGLAASVVAGYDLVIVSNPGYPLSDKLTLTTLLAFTGGVILIGDDMSQGAGFSIESLTGLSFKNNGTSMSCNGKTFGYDNLEGSSYQIEMNEEFLPGLSDADQHYTYGNDLDWTTADTGVQVLATATAAAGTCDIGQIPAVVRRPKSL
jgi:hypothetical protein